MQILVSLTFGIVPAVINRKWTLFFLEKNRLLPENQKLLLFGGKWHNARQRPVRPLINVNTIWCQIKNDADL